MTDYTQEDARRILLNPDLLKKEYATEKENNFKNVSASLIELVKGDNDFLKELVELYTPLKAEGFVPSTAINAMKTGDDTYFIRKFEEEGYHIGSAALGKVEDLNYVIGVINQEARNDNNSASPQSSVLFNRAEELYQKDPEHFETLRNCDNFFIKRAANDGYNGIQEARDLEVRVLSRRGFIAKN